VKPEFAFRRDLMPFICKMLIMHQPPGFPGEESSWSQRVSFIYGGEISFIAKFNYKFIEGGSLSFRRSVFFLSQDHRITPSHTRNKIMIYNEEN
jgi:hypothetical protein